MFFLNRKRSKKSYAFFIMIKCNTIFQFNCFCIYMTFIIYHSDKKRSKVYDKSHKRDVMKHRCVLNYGKLRLKCLFFNGEKMFFSQNVDRSPFKWWVSEKK